MNSFICEPSVLYHTSAYLNKLTFVNTSFRLKDLNSVVELVKHAI